MDVDVPEKSIKIFNKETGANKSCLLVPQSLHSYNQWLLMDMRELFTSSVMQTAPVKDQCSVELKGQLT